MKFNLTMAALIAVISMHTLHADDQIASKPESLQTPVEVSASAIGNPPLAASQVSVKQRKTPASATNRKVATDYVPAQELLLSAMSLIGVKYKWGGNTPESGLDCSGFIHYVFQNTLNIALPRTALGMSRVGDTIDKDELKPGDLVFFNTLKRRFSHVGIYLGDNRFIHAPRTGRNIEIANMDTKYWTSRFNGGRRMSELSHTNIDIDALLKSLPEKPIKETKESTPSANCRKVTSIRKGKKITSTVCSNKSVKPKPVTQKTAKRAAQKAKTATSSGKKKTASVSKKKH